MQKRTSLHPQYKLESYAYHLPPERIADFPALRRTQARLLHLHQGGLSDRHIHQLPQLLTKGDVLVLNNTKVLPTRFAAVKQTGGKVEILLNRFFSPTEAEAMLRCSRPPKPGEVLTLTDRPDIKMHVLGRAGEFFRLGLSTGENFYDLSRRHGQLPLPPYIRRPARPADYKRYQTTFAKQPGAIAAPTAGLHFSRPLFQAIQARGVRLVELTLHTGAATFAPIRVEDIRRHEMHYEWCELSAPACRVLNRAKQEGRHIIAVGTTALRTMETAWQDRRFTPYKGWTNLFIYPGSKPIQTADRLLTNFHLPRSSLLLLVCAFGGYQQIMHAYKHAVTKHYRFFSYGDAMLIEREG